MPKLSIVVLTYNHEKFIQKSLSSILEQKVNFEYEVLVIDDGSSDNTNRIVRELADKHPQINLITSTENKGVRNSVFEAFENLKGEYLAVLDGDDYWCNSNKLQTQIDFLESNPDFVGTFHDAEIINEVVNGNKYFDVQKTYSQRYFFNEIVYGSEFIGRKFIIPSSSLVMRTESFVKLNLNLFHDNLSLEWKLLVMTLRGEKMKFFNEIWSVYRNHDTGISKSNKEKFHLSHIHFLESLLKEDDFHEYHLELYDGIISEMKILLENKNETDLYDKKKLFKTYQKFEKKRMKAYKIRLIK